MTFHVSKPNFKIWFDHCLTVSGLSVRLASGRWLHFCLRLVMTLWPPSVSEPLQINAHRETSIYGSPGVRLNKSTVMKDRDGVVMGCEVLQMFSV